MKTKSSHDDLRKINQILWALLWPARAYIRYSPIMRGKGFLNRNLIKPALPSKPYGFLATLPEGQIEFKYHEELGVSTLLYGLFERAEIEYLTQHLSPGGVALDIGANIGIFTVAFGHSVGLFGKVMAFEPLQENLDRLKHNIDLNKIGNIEVYPIALGEKPGLCDIHLAKDSAYASTVGVYGVEDIGATHTVKMDTLDNVWIKRGKPSVNLIKIDVEGAEASVIKGGTELLHECHPLLLIEANTNEYLEELCVVLKTFGYQFTQPEGFASWNYIFYTKKIT